jgi:hypothetical protein
MFDLKQKQTTRVSSIGGYYLYLHFIFYYHQDKNKTVSLLLSTQPCRFGITDHPST